MADKTLNKSLPGTLVTVNDGGLAITPPPGGTKVTILGTTTNDTLEVGEPTRIRDRKLVSPSLDHSDGTPSELSLAVEEAFRVGAENVEVVRIADASGEDTGSYTPENRFDHLEAAYDILKVTPVDIVVPYGARFEDNPTGVNALGTTRKPTWKQLGDFCYQATKEANNVIGVIGTKTPNEVAFERGWTGQPTGRAGILFNTPSIAHIQEWVKYLTAQVGTFGTYTAEHWTDYLAGSNETSPGVLDTNYDGWARETDGSIALDNKGNQVDGGARLSIVAMASRIRHDRVRTLAAGLGISGQTDMNHNGAVAYAALLSRLPAEIGATNHTMAGVSAARQLAASLAKDLMNFRYVTALDRALGYVIAKDTTGAHFASAETKSDFVLTQIVRIVDEAIDIVRETGEEFISKPINAANLGAFESAVRQSLTGMKTAGALRRFDFGVIADVDAQILGEINVDLTLVPAVELLTINTQISLAKE
jgi:hypothetical protein